jgi:hypothetical protein
MPSIDRVSFTFMSTSSSPGVETLCIILSAASFLYTAIMYTKSFLLDGMDPIINLSYVSNPVACSTILARFI